MLSDEQLGELLRADLHAIADDIQPSPDLISRCLPTRRSWLRRSASLRVLVPAGMALAALIVAAVFAFSGSTASPAFALTVGGRSVHVTLDQITGVSDLNRELKGLAFPVRAVPMTATCHSHVGMSYMGVVADRPAHIQPPRDNALPAGETIILAALQTGPNLVTFAIGHIVGPVPSCVSSHGLGPGLPGWHLPERDRLPTGSSGA